MRRFTIIKSDNHVYIDGQMMVVDCSSLPDDFHALQWDVEKGEGWIEYVNHVRPNEPITDIEAYQNFITGWLTEETRQKELVKIQQAEWERIQQERRDRTEKMKAWEEDNKVYTATDKIAYEAFYDEETGTFKPSHTS